MPEILTLEVGPMTHGGHCIARHQGRVIFVRHGIPGETVRAVITDGGDKARFWRADVVDVLAASDHRRRHPWKQADSLRAHDQNQLPVGGAEYGHISEAHQRRLKSHVFRDTMARIGGIQLSELDLKTAEADGEVHVENIGGSTSAGLNWRTRVSFAVHQGALAMKPHRSHEPIALRSMPLAVEAITDTRLFSWNFHGADQVDVVAAGAGAPLTLIVRARTGADVPQLRQLLVEQAAVEPDIGNILLGVAKPHRGRRGRGRRISAPTAPSYQVVLGEAEVTEPLPQVRGSKNSEVRIPAEGFWQIHREAPTALVRAVGQMCELQAGGTMIDLYAGAGLFTAWGSAQVGAQGSVLSVEASAGSSAAAARLFADNPEVEVVAQAAEHVAQRLRQSDVVLLDPPRAGADPRVLEGITDSNPEQIIYVSCDPASFARDAKLLAASGWQIQELTLLDMYPNTHHMESVALLRRSAIQAAQL